MYAHAYGFTFCLLRLPAMSTYAETGPAPKPMRARASTYYNRPLPPLPSTDTPAAPKRRRTFKPPSPSLPPSSSPSPPSTGQHRLSQFPTPPPMLLPQEQVSALSLQDHAFLYILGNVDNYPAELLALLPLHWRRKLLSALPPFRLHQLEDTPITRGVDTQEIWEELGKLQDCVWAGYLSDRDTPPSSQDDARFPPHWGKEEHRHGHAPETLRMRFVNYLSHLLFNEMNRDYACKRITELLHATHVDMLEPTLANGLIYGHVNSLFMFQPPYYLIPFRCPNLTERELYWSLYGNKMLPTSIELYVYNIDSSPLWNQELISQEMMRRMLSRLRFLRLYNHMYKTSQLEEIVNAVTHSSRYKEPPSNMGSLKHLEVLRSDDRHLSTVVPFFSAPNGYSHLTSITISMRPVHYIQTTRHLGPLIKHQLNSLRHLELRGFSCCLSRNIIHMCDYMFFSSLASLVLKTRFRSLIFRGFKDMPWKMLQMVLEANLRTVPSHNQTILLDDVSVTTKGELPFSDPDEEEEEEWSDGEGEWSDTAGEGRSGSRGSGGFGENQFCPASESKCLEHKHIRFRNCHLPVELLDWFERTDRVCVHTLEFNQVTVDVSKSLDLCNIDTISFSTGMNGVVYGYHVRRKQSSHVSELELKSKFLLHKQFECCVFVWIDVRVDNTCVLNL